eukprot:TRINITY_DN88145_c0_g1_i1.p1 TRINITY_DN88145_c0_g1~~TRINITY_DN88145_c0_g1_i1.p1  ORF type:complete len:296 (-),score=32.80 TRINITY_DN88145_c0_g1_i1:227-1114(-)
MEDGNPLPGSLEEDLTATPEMFFENSPYETEVNKLYITSEPSHWNRLTSAGIALRPEHHPEEKTDPPVSVRFKGVKSVISQDFPNNGGNKLVNDRSKKAIKRMDISDADLSARYEEIITRLHSRFNSPANTLMTRPCTTKQERFFENHKRTQQTWERNLKTACKKLGRPPAHSVMAQAEGYREKVEKVAVLEAATPSEVKFGVRNWSMGLRCTPQSKEIRHYAVSIGNSYTGLWMQVMDNPNKQTEVIRNPQRAKSEYKTFKNSRALQEKIKNEAKKIKEIMPMRDDSIEDLQVI